MINSKGYIKDTKYKIGILGTGNVGGTTAAILSSMALGDIFLYDKVPGITMGKAMDIEQSHDCCLCSKCIGVKGLSEVLENAQFVVVTAGIALSKGLCRDDLVNQNAEIILPMGEAIIKHCPEAFVLIVTNPVDALATIMQRHFPQMNVYGLGCALDTVRFQFYLAQEAQVSKNSVSAIVVGTHNDNMIPLIRTATIGGVPATYILDETRLNEIVKNIPRAGYEIVKNLKKTGSFLAASKLICNIAKSVIRNENQVFTLSVVNNKSDYKTDDCCISFPVVIGSEKNKRILPIKLTDEEKIIFDKSVNGIKTVTQGL